MLINQACELKGQFNIDSQFRSSEFFCQIWLIYLISLTLPKYRYLNYLSSTIETIQNHVFNHLNFSCHIFEMFKTWTHLNRPCWQAWHNNPPTRWMLSFMDQGQLCKLGKSTSERTILALKPMGGVKFQNGVISSPTKWTLIPWKLNGGFMVHV